MVKLAYIFHARGNVALIQIYATPPLHSQALSDTGMTALLEEPYFAYNRRVFLCAKVLVKFSAPPKKWEEEKWQANCTDRIKHNKATVVATRFVFGCAAVPKMYLELQYPMFRFLSKENTRHATLISIHQSCNS